MASLGIEAISVFGLPPVAFVELGTPRINAVSMDPDFARTCDEFARLAELAAGIRGTTEEKTHNAG